MIYTTDRYDSKVNKDTFFGFEILWTPASPGSVRSLAGLGTSERTAWVFMRITSRKSACPDVLSAYKRLSHVSERAKLYLRPYDMTLIP